MEVWRHFKILSLSVLSSLIWIINEPVLSHLLQGCHRGKESVFNLTAVLTKNWESDLTNTWLHLYLYP